ncbi:MAG: pirin family protein [Bacteroidales bacterium]|nr:pirin family protein [Bacteroidales bacterium]MBN2819370.1 pirin family protein [Bacteroidales bacterium]
MQTILHKANTRGHFNHGWLNTHHSFSFAHYYDPDRVNFGALRVLNDDIIHPGEGFGRHPHDNMEIITIPLEGGVLHRDSMGNEEIIKAGEVQVMSAGTGIFHEEYNASKESHLSLLQIWIFPKEKNIKPTYDQVEFDKTGAFNQWQKLVTKDEEGTLHIHQDAQISRTFLSEGKTLEYSLKESSYGSYLFVIDGEVSVNGSKLGKRDAIGINNVGKFEIHAKKDAHILNIEVPE